MVLSGYYYAFLMLNHKADDGTFELNIVKILQLISRNVYCIILVLIVMCETDTFTEIRITKSINIV